MILFREIEVVKLLPFGQGGTEEGRGEHGRFLGYFREDAAHLGVFFTVFRVVGEIIRPLVNGVGGEYQRRADGERAYRPSGAPREVPVIQDGGVKQEDERSVGILEEYIMLIDVVGHQIDEEIRERQDQALYPLAEKGKKSQRDERLQYKHRLWRVPGGRGGREYLVYDPRRVFEDVDDDRYQSSVRVGEIGEAVRHYPDPEFRHQGDRRREVYRGEAERREPDHLRPLPFLSGEHEQGEKDDVDRRVLFYKAGERREAERPDQALALDEVNEPEQQRGEKLVFVDVEEGPARKRGVEDVDERKDHPRLSGKPQPLADHT